MTYPLCSEGTSFKASKSRLSSKVGDSIESAKRFFGLLHNDLLITQFTVQPFDPAPYEDYVVTVSYECYSSNLVVQMHIIGTDYYTKNIYCFSGPSCVLRVPGAVALVRDLVTVTAQDNSVQVERRVIILF